MGKKSKANLQIEPTSSHFNLNEMPHVKEKVKINKNKNTRINNGELETDLSQRDVATTNHNLQAAIKSPASVDESVSSKKKKIKSGASPEDEEIDERELDSFCDNLDEEADSKFASWVKLLEVELSGSKSLNRKKKKKVKVTSSNSSFSETLEQSSSDVPTNKGSINFKNSQRKKQTTPEYELCDVKESMNTVQKSTNLQKKKKRISSQNEEQSSLPATNLSANVGALKPSSTVSEQLTVSKKRKLERVQKLRK